MMNQKKKDTLIDIEIMIYQPRIGIRVTIKISVKIRIKVPISLDLSDILRGGSGSDYSID